jgi:hypothetical protein
MTIYRWVLFRMRSVSNESCTENQNAHFILIVLLPTNAHPLFCFYTSLYNLADMFRSVWIIIGAFFTWTSLNFLHHTYKSLQSSIFKIFKICLRCVVYLVCCVFHVSWSITLAFRVCLCCPVVTDWLLLLFLLLFSSTIVASRSAVCSPRSRVSLCRAWLNFACFKAICVHGDCSF